MGNRGRRGPSIIGMKSKTKGNSKAKPRKKSSKNAKNKPIQTLLMHDNKTQGHTTKAHEFARRLDKKSDFKVLHDQKVWKPGEKTSSTETDNREREMVKKSDLGIRVVPATSKTGSPRNEGAQREVRKFINAGKPVIEIYERGAKDSPNRPIQEKNYKNRVPVRLQEGERLETGLKRGMKELEKKGLVKNKK